MKKPPKTKEELGSEYERWFKLIAGPTYINETPRETQERLAKERKKR